MQPYLFITTTKFSAEADKETHNVDVAHVRRPVHRTAILLVKRVNCRTFLQQQLRHLHTHGPAETSSTDLYEKYILVVSKT